MAGPVVISPRTGSLPSACAMRPIAAAWSMNVELSPTRTSGSSPGGSTAGSVQSGSSRRAPVTCTCSGGWNPGYWSARVLSISTRSQSVIWSSACRSGASPCARRASLIADRPLFHIRSLIEISRSRMRPQDPPQVRPPVRRAVRSSRDARPSWMTGSRTAPRRRGRRSSSRTSASRPPRRPRAGA